MKPLKNNFPKWNFYKQRAEFDNSWFIFTNQKLSSYRVSFPGKNDPWFIRIASISKIWLEAIRNKVRAKIKFINKIIFLCFKFFSWIFSLFKDPFNDKIAIFGSKIIYFCLRPNFRECSTLTQFLLKCSIILKVASIVFLGIPNKFEKIYLAIYE